MLYVLLNNNPYNLWYFYASTGEEILLLLLYLAISIEKKNIFLENTLFQIYNCTDIQKGFDTLCNIQHDWNPFAKLWLFWSYSN